ncbi:von Willebrand factor type A domain protein [Symmachiella macrocystis]|uniref:von Willebrand factor type A domain protein n=1 Tax=Symmachiella macrocystis TaxID=2527985 RepID=A0A5C6BNZ3_9PLAN|nr:VWA domain-containing protein [Symmachiella macrocystis]TWU13111.1 von Willebrand factor type A domain protein [Symmachiella macrocystis]
MYKLRRIVASKSESSNRRGAMAVLVGAMLVIFVAAVAFSVDVAYMQLCRTELQVSTDAAARAAGEALTRSQDMDAARQAARDLAAVNLVALQPLLLDDADIIPGNSDFQENGSWAFTPQGTPINSIRVIGRRTRISPSGSIGLYFAKIFDQDDFEVTRASTVVRLDRDICIVVDRSGSMKWDVEGETAWTGSNMYRFEIPPEPDSRWVALSVATKAFTEALGLTPQVEWVGLVSYASDYTNFGVQNHRVDIDQGLTENHALIDSAMDDITARIFNGATDIAAGIDSGKSVLLDPNNSRPFAVKTLILMSDGHPTSGGDPLVSANYAAQNNITIHTISFGEADLNLMQQIATAGGGQHFHALDAESLKAIFKKIALTIPVTFTE